MQGGLSLELFNEWQDIVETDYFAGCLYELIKTSFENLLELIETEVSKDPNCLTQN